ncbi:hypothetical protein AB0D12_04535 [Streptomyces sp. NPDC048479]
MAEDALATAAADQLGGRSARSPGAMRAREREDRLSPDLIAHIFAGTEGT